MQQAFRCINNDAMNKAMALHQQLMEDFNQQSAALAEEFGGTPFANYWRNGRREMRGIKLPKGADSPGKVWRRDAGYDYMFDADVYLPNARSNGGKEMRARIAALKVDPFSIPGLPGNVFLAQQSLMVSPGSYQINGNWYADYSEQIPEYLKHVDRDIWEDVRASDLLRLQEDEAMKAAPADTIEA